MSLEIVTAILTFAGGVGMFVYGMQVMADGLQKAAGAKTRRMLEILTSNRLLGVLVGAAVTAIIQSSGATTVMVVGFVNASLMTLQQAVGVIMGANIGTTMTAWIVSMGEWAAFLKPEMIAPLLMVVGVTLQMILKSERGKEAANILIGFGLLFIGLSTMSGAVTPYADAPIFLNVFKVIGANPILGLIVGALVTAIMQSSSASMGILQTLALTGIVNWGSAVFIALGQNIGTCVVALISAIGADTNAKRAAMIHLEFNVIGSILVGTAAAIYFAFSPAMMHMPVTSTNLAIFHTSFNVISTIILFPFANQLVQLSKLFIHDPKTVQDDSKEMVRLDDRLLSQPQFALAAVRKEMLFMGKLALENIGYSRDCLIDHEGFEKLAKNEAIVDHFYNEINGFLEKLDTTHLTESQQLQLKHMVLAVRDIEHISDRCKEIAGISSKYLSTSELSENMIEDLNTISTDCSKAVATSLELYSTKSALQLEQVNRLEEAVDVMENDFRNQYFKKLAGKTTHVIGSVVFLEAVDCYERIADHAKLLAHYIALEEPSLLSSVSNVSL